MRASSTACRRAACCLALLGLWSARSTAIAQDAAAGDAHFSADRIVAISDIHGAYPSLVHLLTETGVLDDLQHWSGQTTHLVITGDILDRGPESRKVMDLLMGLEIEAVEDGGRVHVLLGNHEVLNISGDLRYVSGAEFAAFADEEPAQVREKFWQRFIGFRGGEFEDESLARAAFDELYPPGFFGHLAAFGPDGEYGRWLLTKPVLVTINDTVFVHGGLPAALLETELAVINKDYVESLKDYAGAWRRLIGAGVIDPHAGPGAQRDTLETYAADGALEGPLADAAHDVLRLEQAGLFNINSPVWYRGTAGCNALAEADTTSAVLKKLDARRVVVGHTPTMTRRVVSRLDGRAILIDTGMLSTVYRGRPSAIVIEGGELRVRYAGEPGFVEPVREQRRVGVRALDLSAADVERLLTQAEIVERTPVFDPAGDYQYITLQAGSVQLNARFNPVDGSRGVTRRRSGSDSYFHDIAAYRVDRMLDARLVPVTVLRVLDGKPGSLQFLPVRTITEEQRSLHGQGGDALCALHRQIELMYGFDALIYNEERRPTTILYDASTWQMLLVDHSRAFRAKRGKPRYLAQTSVRLSQEFARRLRGLNSDMLRTELSDILSEKQIRSLERRRDELLETATVEAAF